MIQAAQDFTTHTGHLFQLRQAFYQLDVVPKIDGMVRERISPAEYERYLKDPERPAFLQALREHEIGGRRIEDVLDSITAEPLDGLRSIAAGLHGRAGKEPPPARGETKTWAERTPGQASAEIQAAEQMADQRQAELGRELAERPPRWALQAWGVPPAHQESAARRADWEKQAGIVGAYRELAGIADPAQAIGPVPSGQPDLAEMFHASVRALQLPDEAALLKAMGQGELEAAVDEHDRAIAMAPADVQAEIDQREAELEDAHVRAHIAGGVQDAGAQAQADAEARDAAADLARLAVADAARREWAEAHAGLAARAEAAERELRGRGLAERIPVTDAGEAAEASAEPRLFPEIDPADAARWKAEQKAELDAYRQAQRELWGREIPVTEGGGSKPRRRPTGPRPRRSRRSSVLSPRLTGGCSTTSGTRSWAARTGPGPRRMKRTGQSGKPARSGPPARRTSPRYALSSSASASWLTGFPTRPQNDALRWRRRALTSRWYTSLRPSLSLSPHGSLAMLRAGRSRRPRRTPSRRWRSAQPRRIVVLLQIWARTVIKRTAAASYTCGSSRKHNYPLGRGHPGMQKAPDAREARPGPSGTVRCSETAAAAPTATASPGCSRPHRTGTTSRSG